MANEVHSLRIRVEVGDQMRVNFLWAVLRHTFNSWLNHDAPRMGAALAFYTMVSMAPLVVLVTAMVAMFFGQTTAQDQILYQVHAMIGRDGAVAVKTMIESAQKQEAGGLAAIIGLLTLLLGATGVFGELRAALNTVWGIKAQSTDGVLVWLKERIFSFGMVLAIGFLLIVSLVISAAIAAGGKFFGSMLPAPEAALGIINFVASFGAVTVLFALTFRYVPDVKIAWREVWLGASVTALLFTVGKTLIGLYLGKAAVGSAYGAGGSLIALLVWVYYSSMIFLFGAEFTHVVYLHKHRGRAARLKGRTR